MKTLTLVALIAAVLFSGCGAKSVEAAERAPVGGWVVDKAKSRLEFSGTQTGKEFSGAFGAFTAAIVFDPADLSDASINVVIDASSAKTGDRQRDAALPTPDWFSARAFPMATFSASEIVAVGDGAYEARGRLTIREAARDLALPFTLAIDGDKAVADGAATLVRTDFGVGQGEFATGKWVGLEVKVTVHIEASR
jgi:polyisoprenoid-binding protein YceI